MEDHKDKQMAKRPLVFLQNKFKKETGEILPRWVVRSLIKRYGFNEVISCLSENDFSDKRNPIGYLTEAIKNGWRVFKEPEYLKQYEVEKKRQLREAEGMRTDRIREGYEGSQEQKENERRQELSRQVGLIKNL